MAWVLTKSLTELRNNFNEIAPNRDKSSDGSIGDTAHQREKSGHNPDDTPGVTAEYSDADSKQEVRAIDVDVDLRQPGVTMLKVIQSILADPNARKRLKYIIYNRVIWSASKGWQASRYTGANAHDHHAHFSGNPEDDENSKPWPAVLKFKEEEDMGLEGADLKRSIATNERVQQSVLMQDTTNITWDDVPNNVEQNLLVQAVKRIDKNAATAATREITITLTQEQLDTLAAQVTAATIAALTGGAFVFTENPAK